MFSLTSNKMHMEYKQQIPDDMPTVLETGKFLNRDCYYAYKLTISYVTLNKYLQEITVTNVLLYKIMTNVQIC